MKWLAKLFHKSEPITMLAWPPDIGPTVDWSGPEIPLAGDHRPTARLLCILLADASKRSAEVIQLSLCPPKHYATVQFKTPQGSESTPHLPGFLWSSLVFVLPDVSVLESCQGVLTDPASQARWCFSFTKENNQIMLTKLPAE